MPSSSSSNLSLGPGRLFYAPLGTADITDHTTALPSTWLEIGYTKEGSEISYSFNSEAVEVAEVADAIAHATSSREGTITFAMAETTVRNMTVAFNGGTVSQYGTGPTAGFKYEPPALGAEVRLKMVWVSQDGKERWLLRQVFQTGDVAIARRKSAADYATLPVTFAIEAPTTGLQPFAAFFASTRDGGYVAVA